MCHLQQTGSECLPAAVLRPGHLRELYVLTWQLTTSRRLLIEISLGQVSLPETCPVCAHNPVSSDLCKPNKALRTTLKAFLRTEEKKREKDRQSTITPADDASAPTDSGLDQSATDATPTKDATAQTLRTESTSHERSEDAPAGTVTENGPERDPVESVEPVHRVNFPVGSYMCDFPADHR